MRLQLPTSSADGGAIKKHPDKSGPGNAIALVLLAVMLSVMLPPTTGMAAGETCSVYGTIELPDPLSQISHDQIVLEFYDAAGDGTTPLISQQVSTTGVSGVSFSLPDSLTANTTYKIRCDNPPGSTAPFVPAWHDKAAFFEAATAVTCAPPQDITGITFSLVAPRFSLSGRVTLNGTGLANVIVTLSGPDLTTLIAATDVNGDYIFTDLYAGDYTVTPAKDYLIFTPAALSTTISATDLIGQDFTVAPLYSISGLVTDNGVAAPDVTLTLTGNTSNNQQIAPPLTTTTGTDGSYSFTDLPTGSYTITPAKGMKVFEPENLEQQVIASDIMARDFAVVSPAIDFAGNLVLTGLSNYVMCTTPPAIAYQQSTDTDGQYTTGGVGTSERTYFLGSNDTITLELSDFSLGYFEQVVNGSEQCTGDRRVYVNGRGVVKVNGNTELIARDISMKMTIDYQSGAITGAGVAALDMDDPSVSFLRQEFNNNTGQVEFLFSSFSPIRQDDFGVYAFNLTLRAAETPAPFVFFRNDPYTVAENGTELTVTVGLSNPSTDVVTVDYATGDTTATAGLDYTATSGTLTWAAGESMDKSFTIPVIRDAEVENEEHFDIILTNGVNTIILQTTATGAITNTCNGDDTTGDSDGDGVCDNLDVCTGDDAAGDTDSDGLCDDVDPCPLDNPDDSDSDGICDSNDLCFGDNATGDTDGDGLCGDVDPCPLDNPDDSDSDGICDSDDLCFGDNVTGDSDGDGICDSDDLCFGDNATGDSDGDGFCDDLDAAAGDIDDNGSIGLADAILALQITAAIEPATAVNVMADVNGDWAIGVAEALYDLQVTAGLR